MAQDLIGFLSKFDTFTKGEIEQLSNRLQVKEFSKGTVVLKAGQISTVCYFVLNGCLRQYILADGIEKTVNFFTEDQAVVLFSNYIENKPSDSFLVAAEDTLVLFGNTDDDQIIYREFPKLEQITRLMVEADFGKVQDNYNRVITSSPEERYLHLLDHRPDLLNRVPLHQLASYLGITPESLSRIRKRLTEK